MNLTYTSTRGQQMTKQVGLQGTNSSNGSRSLFTRTRTQYGVYSITTDGRVFSWATGKPRLIGDSGVLA